VEGIVDVQVGSTITNGSSCIRVTERVEKDARWGTPGWRGMCIPLEAFGGNAGTTQFVPDYLLTGWYHVPFEWRPCVGGGVEERYVWTADWRRLQRQVRTTPLAVGERVKFRDDKGGGEGVGIVRRAEPGKVWVETLFNMWRGADPAWFVRTSDPLPVGLEEDEADQCRCPIQDCAHRRPAVQPTVDGIRGHRVDTPEEAELRRTLALQDTIGADQVLRLLTEES
jgi:hypothetical protein